MTYYLDLYERGEILADLEGIECFDADAARCQAILTARDLMSCDIKEGRLALSSYIQIRDDQSQAVMTVQFKEVLMMV